MNYKKITQLQEIQNMALAKLFDAFRIDWMDCFSSMLGENFVIHLN
jgi:hypothetical protein